MHFKLDVMKSLDADNPSLDKVHLGCCIPGPRSHKIRGKRLLKTSDLLEIGTNLEFTVHIIDSTLKQTNRKHPTEQ